MKNYMGVIQRSELFNGVSLDEAESVLNCLGAKIFKYRKNEFILYAGEKTECVGLLLDGGACIIQEDFWGNRNIISKIVPGQLFAESFACVREAVSNVNVVSESESVVLFLNVQRILTVCPASCKFHNKLILNLTSELANKNLRLNEKLTHMSKRTTREKLLSYLSAESLRNKSDIFEIQYNRQQLADYLSIDRSAMSSALCKLRDEGVIIFNRNHFELLGEISV